MSSPEVDLLIIGGGIAGVSAAYFAERSGRKATLIDANQHRASAVPTALINPVRGYQGKVMERGLEGARFSFALIEALIAAGYPIVHGRGLWRPVPDESVRTLWQANLADVVPHQWHREVPAHLRLQASLQESPAGALYLPDSGWVETQMLLNALLAESSATYLQAEVSTINAALNSVVLKDGRSLRARQLLWCGGAWGAAQQAYTTSFRPGSLLMTSTRLSDEAVSYGLYGAPHAAGSVIGPTTEPITHTFDPGPSPPAWLARTEERAHEMFTTPFTVGQHWHGVRLEATALPPGLPHLTGLGSRGYLMAPLLAAQWAAGLTKR
jgi:glycine/D-amino acid oxidase-like deaminating enzyme